MACEKFKEYTPRAKNAVLLEKINGIIGDYMGRGYKMSDRQIYYQLVGKNEIVNNTAKYNSLTTLLTNGRMGGLIDWDAIEDRNRSTHLPYYYDNVTNAIEDALLTYRLDRLRNQSVHIEVMIEKMAIHEIVKEITDWYGIRLTGDRGNCSVALLREISRRLIRACDEGKRCVILYIGDHDPSGCAMDDNIIDKLSSMGVPEFEFKRVALTHEQAIQYNLPPNKLKETDKNSKGYKDKHGIETCWECDALPTDVLHDLLYRAIWDLIDLDKFHAMLDQEKAEKQQLQALIDSWKMTTNFN